MRYGMVLVPYRNHMVAHVRYTYGYSIPYGLLQYSYEYGTVRVLYNISK